MKNSSELKMIFKISSNIKIKRINYLTVKYKVLKMRMKVMLKLLKKKKNNLKK